MLFGPSELTRYLHYCIEHQLSCSSQSYSLQLDSLHFSLPDNLTSTPRHHPMPTQPDSGGVPLVQESLLVRFHRRPRSPSRATRRPLPTWDPPTRPPPPHQSPSRARYLTDQLRYHSKSVFMWQASLHLEAFLRQSRSKDFTLLLSLCRKVS
jgi:hypothetical protein